MRAAIMLGGLLGLVPVASADTLSDASQWLRDKLETHGVTRERSQGGILELRWHLETSGCLFTFMITGSTSEGGSTSGPPTTVQMGKTNPKKFRTSSMPNAPIMHPYSCAQIISEEKVFVTRGKEDKPDWHYEVCFDQADLGERAVKAFVDAATACGAKAPSEKY
jgi:hypothetical protein